MGAAEAERLREYERGFRRAGLPLFIAERSAATDVFNRAVPLIGLVFLVEMLGALNLEWSPLANVAAVAAASPSSWSAIVLINGPAGRPAWRSRRTSARRSSPLFVIVPALLPLIFGGQWRSAIVTAVGNLVLLGLIYAVVGFGLVSILRWTLGRLVGQLRASLELFARAIPLLMIFSVVLFLTAEMWQVFTTVEPAALGDPDRPVRPPGDELPGRAPAARGEGARARGGRDAPPLDRRERVNVGLVMFVSQALQVLS